MTSPPNPKDDDFSTSLQTEQVSCHVLRNLVDSIIYDVASECHRMARLGLDCNSSQLEEEEEELIRLSAEAQMGKDPIHISIPTSTNSTSISTNGGEVVNGGGKYIVDIFGQTHPAVANEIFECMNCGQSIMAGRFAPHLEKCMGKGRRARQKARRSSRIAQNHQQQQQQQRSCSYTRRGSSNPAAAAAVSVVSPPPTTTASTSATCSHLSSTNGTVPSASASASCEERETDMILK